MKTAVSQAREVRPVVFVGLVLTLLLGAIAVIAQQFAYAADAPPIVLVTLLFFIASLFSLVGVYAAIQVRSSMRTLTWIVLLFAVSLRLIQIFSPPILEIDLYRYMWDGTVTNHGLSPYRFSPSEALTTSQILDDPLHEKIVGIAHKSESIHTIASRVHFEEYTTIYPPVSQAVFAAAMWVVPDTASVQAHLFCMKAFLVGFDVATMLVILHLLVRLKIHSGWLVVYAWNPLVIKEVANSGHLDSIAVFFTTAAVSLVVHYWNGTKQQSSSSAKGALVLGSATLLALGIGAKLFPIILVPLLSWTLGRRSKSMCALFLLTFTLTSAAVMWPMLRENPSVQSLLSSDNEPLDRESKEGLTSFLAKWRMNDLAFSFVYENAKPNVADQPNPAWYVFTPNSWRHQWNQWLKERVDFNPAFFTARVITLFTFLVGLIWLFYRPRSETQSSELLNDAFLVIAIFFFLQPTQNPWYWLWAMPFACFARNRGWLLVSAFLFTYYLRFSFKRLEGETNIFGVSYSGAGLFDHFVVWFEYGFMLIALIGFAVRQRIIRKNDNESVAN